MAFFVFAHDVDMSTDTDQRPADIFIDRYMPGANAREREEVRENVRDFVAVLVRINARLALEAEHNSDSPESEGRGRVGIPSV